MLSPNYLLHISEGAEAIASELHNRIMRQIIKRIMLRMKRGEDYLLTAQDKYQLDTLQEAGFLLDDIQAEIEKAIPKLQGEVAGAMEEAGVKAIDADDAIYTAAGLSPDPLERSPHLIRLMQRNYEATMGEMADFTRTMPSAGQQAYIAACDTVYNLVSTGAQGYGGAFAEAIKDLLTKGVTTVEYDSGHTDTVETAVLRAVRTGVSQATAEITDARMDEMGWDIVLVSSHLGARVTDKEDFTNHAWWQGKFYSRSGKGSRFPPFSVCGMGNVQGIHGANCRHSHGPGDGVHNPYEQYDSAENQKEYDLQQRQRTLERRIRGTRRDVLGWKTALDNAPENDKIIFEAEYQKKAALLQKQTQQYNGFCKENNLKRLSERLKIAAWDRSQAQKARAAAQRWYDAH